MRQNKHTEIYPKSRILQNSADFTETCIFSRKTNNITERVAVVKSWITNTSYSLPAEFGTAKHWNIQSTEAAVVSLHRSVAAPPPLAITLARCSILWRQSVASSSAICGVLWHRVATTRQYIVRQLLMHTHTHTHTGRKRRDSMYRVTRLSSGRGCCCCCYCRIKLANHSYSRSLAPSMSFWQCFIYQQVVYRNDKIKILILN